MRVIAFANQKGGVGKTTSALNVGAGLALLGKSVLLVDLDPQGNLTRAVLGYNPNKIEQTVYHLLMQRCGIDDVLILTKKYVNENNWPQLWLLPANKKLVSAELELVSVTSRETRLKKALSLIKDNTFDYILIDCPPNLNLLTVNALAACQEIIIPVQTEFFALDGMSTLLNLVHVVKEELNPGLTILGILATLFDKRKILNNEVVNLLVKNFGDLVFSTKIRSSVALAEAPSHGLDIYQYRKNSYGAEDYLNLCREIESRGVKE